MPISAPDRPSRIAALPNVAAVEQIRISAARHSAKPAADARPVHRGDHRLRHVADGLGQCGHPSPGNCSRSRAERRRVGHAGPEVAHVDPSTETASRTGQHDGADSGRPQRPRTGPLEFADHHLVDRVQPVGPVEAHDERRRIGASRRASASPARQTRSMIVAVPMPPPVHMVTSPVVRSRRSNSSSRVPISIAPVAPIGWPERDGATVDVDPLGVELQVAHRLHRHGGERLVDFPEVDVADVACPPWPGSVRRPDPVRSA